VVGGSGSGGGSNSGGSAGATTAATASVGMAGRAFGSSTVTIAAGGSVTWRNDDDRAHTVTATDGAFNSGTMNEGASWKRTFREAGSFRYLCAIHPEMTGTVIVKSTGLAQSKPTPKPTPTPAPPAPTSAPDGAAAPPEVTAEARDFVFAPAELSVPVGTRLTWRNTGQAPHTVTAEDGSFDSGMIAAGGSWSQVFANAGTFRYVCTFHPGMTGVVEATAAAAGAGTSPDPTATPAPSASAGAAAAVPDPTPPAEPPTAVQEPDTAAAASRTAGPNAALMARVGIVGLLIGGSVLLFARVVGGTAGRRPGEVR
jgi:plastocyanin